MDETWGHPLDKGKLCVNMLVAADEGICLNFLGFEYSEGKAALHSLHKCLPVYVRQKCIHLEERKKILKYFRPAVRILQSVSGSGIFGQIHNFLLLYLKRVPAYMTCISYLFRMRLTRVLRVRI